MTRGKNYYYKGYEIRLVYWDDDYDGYRWYVIKSGVEKELRELMVLPLYYSVSDAKRAIDVNEILFPTMK